MLESVNVSGYVIPVGRVYTAPPGTDIGQDVLLTASMAYMVNGMTYDGDKIAEVLRLIHAIWVLGIIRVPFTAEYMFSGTNHRLYLASDTHDTIDDTTRKYVDILEKAKKAGNPASIRYGLTPREDWIIAYTPLRGLWLAVRDTNGASILVADGLVALRPPAQPQPAGVAYIVSTRHTSEPPYFLSPPSVKLPSMYTRANQEMLHRYTGLRVEDVRIPYRGVIKIKLDGRWYEWKELDTGERAILYYFFAVDWVPGDSILIIPSLGENVPGYALDYVVWATRVLAQRAKQTILSTSSRIPVERLMDALHDTMNSGKHKHMAHRV